MSTRQHRMGPSLCAEAFEQTCAAPRVLLLTSTLGSGHRAENLKSRGPERLSHDVAR